VDLSQIARADFSSPPTALKTTTPAPSNGVIPALPGRTAGASGDADRRKRVEAAVAEARDQARTQLEQRLLGAYLAELQRERTSKLQDLEDANRDQISKSYDQTRALFETYARERGPLVIRKNLLFEHPNRKRLDFLGVRPKRDESAKSIQAEIDKLDARYRSEVKTLYDGLQQQYGSDIAKLETEIETKRRALLTKANDEARRQAQQEIVALEGLEKSSPALQLPGAAAKSARVQASSATLPGSVTIEPSLEPKDLRIQAEVWAAVNGYTLSESPSAPDRTEEFKNWIKLRLGR
jgi:hypothetical protein